MAKADFEFYIEAGQLEGPADEPEGRGFLGPRPARGREEEPRWLIAVRIEGAEPAATGSAPSCRTTFGARFAEGAARSPGAVRLAAFLSHPLTLRLLSAIVLCVAWE